MKKILVQLDSDLQPSVFDRVVAIDAGADDVFAYGNVQPDQVEGLVHGAIFTRGPKDLKNTAVFIGGRDVDAGQKLLDRVTKTFFGPIRVSSMIDCNGSNTTAAAAVLAAGRHVDLSKATVVVFGGTGPVGQRVSELVASSGGTVRITSRDLERAEEVANVLREHVKGDGKIEAHETASRSGKLAALKGVQVVFAAGAAGARFLTEKEWSGIEGFRVAVDLNAVPPTGLEGIDLQDKGQERHGVICYGALGVGGLKMKIHRTAIGRMFETNDRVYDVRAIFELGRELGV
ncbi:MAG: NADP-dependent methylenetetrahydromethanopterin/methylenetetrahydrofolate dehydrogenase [Planctomycetota bacterium]|nr:bifunctional NADP-dependent methylenetetrahydromethanopterin dehydrogenase/methylenetetrahydrofolate dehydrogenase [Planctomycetaceae bacterium]MDQ3330584.1 NADP-dependent methylenetetrahydromethanopterin/methylenetetrahydrofolate dehydrogenase [Planctomycetota bacterium]